MLLLLLLLVDLQGVWPLQHLPLFHSDLQEVDSLLLLVLLLLLWHPLLPHLSKAW